MKQWLIILVILGIAVWYFGIQPANIVWMSATAWTICSTGATETTCSVSNYLGLNAVCYEYPGSDELNSVAITGVGRIDGFQQYLSQEGVSYNRCRYACSGSGPASFNTGWIEGTVGVDGCYGTWCTQTGYHGGNAFSVGCQAVFYNEVLPEPPVPPPEEIPEERTIFEVIIGLIKGLLCKYIRLCL